MKAFHARPNQVRLGYARFCSRRCYYESRRGKIIRPPEQMQCRTCGKSFEPRRRGSGQVFCGFRCYGVAQRKRVSCDCIGCGKRLNIKSGDYNKGRRCCSWACYRSSRKVTIACEHCGDSFRVLRCYALRDGTRFCSQACAWSHKRTGQDSVAAYRSRKRLARLESPSEESVRAFINHFDRKEVSK